MTQSMNMKEALLNAGLKIDSLSTVLRSHLHYTGDESMTDEYYALSILLSKNVDMITGVDLDLYIHDYTELPDIGLYLELDLPHINVPECIYRRTNWYQKEKDGYIIYEKYNFKLIESMTEVQEIMEQKKISLQNTIKNAQDELMKIEEASRSCLLLNKGKEAVL